MYNIKLFIKLYIDGRVMPSYRIEKCATIPFVPFPGLSYEDLGKITGVNWDGKRFLCSFKRMQFSTDEYLEEERQLFEQDGWESIAIF